MDSRAGRHRIIEEGVRRMIDEIRIRREDIEILGSDEVRLMDCQYAEKFGESFIYFNYTDFPSTKTRSAAEAYRDALREALKKNEPTHIGFQKEKKDGICITERQKACLKKYEIPFEEALEKDDLDMLLDNIDDAIVRNIVLNGDEPDEVGVLLQRVYDQIYFQN